MDQLGNCRIAEEQDVRWGYKLIRETTLRFAVKMTVFYSWYIIWKNILNKEKISCLGSNMIMIILAIVRDYEG